MQNANIRYLIRIDCGEHKNREVEITLQLSDFETDWTIADEIFDAHQIQGEEWDKNFYTVIERNIELIND